MNGREFRNISDDELEASLGRLLGAGARLEARIVAHLAELEERRLHLLAGHSSLYDYCRKRLGLSDYEAFARIAAAREARKYPIILKMLEQRKLHLTAICEVREFLTDENHRELLEEISGQTKARIREILARCFPQSDVRESVRKLPALEPLSVGRYRLLLTLSAQQKEKLELARDLLSHANPTGDLAVVIERALDALIARIEKRRFGQRERQCSAVSGPRDGGPCDAKPSSAKFIGATPNSATPCEIVLGEVISGEAKANVQQAVEADAKRGSRRRKHIGNGTRREVVARDGVRCSFVGVDGRCCEERGFLQFHHRQPWACGGADTPENLALLCRAHNGLLAERELGKARLRKVIDSRELARRHQHGGHLGQPRRV